MKTRHIWKPSYQDSKLSVTEDGIWIQSAYPSSDNNIVWLPYGGLGGEKDAAMEILRIRSELSNHLHFTTDQCPTWPCEVAKTLLTEDEIKEIVRKRYW